MYIYVVLIESPITEIPINSSWLIKVDWEYYLSWNFCRASAGETLIVLISTYILSDCYYSCKKWKALSPVFWTFPSILLAVKSQSHVTSETDNKKLPTNDEIRYTPCNKTQITHLSNKVPGLKLNCNIRLWLKQTLAPTLELFSLSSSSVHNKWKLLFLVSKGLWQTIMDVLQWNFNYLNYIQMHF